MKMFAKINKENVLDFARKYGIMLVGLLVMYIVFLNYICDNPVLYSKTLSIIVSVVVFLLLVFAGVCSVYFEKELHKFFLVVFAIFGVIYFFVYPIGGVPDEPNHFYRAYEISEGHMVSDMIDGIGGRKLPKGLDLGIDIYTVTLQDSWETLDIKLSEEKIWYGFWSASLYAPISYMPQSLGIFFARMFTDSVAIMFLMGRLFNLVAVGIITYFAVKYIPIGKKLIILITLIPMNMQEAISLAPDAVVTAVIMAFIAYVLYLRYVQENVMSKRQLILLYIMAIVISLNKIVYIPFCILPFLIPPERFGGKKQFVTHAICMGTLVIVAGLGWLAFAGRYLLDIEGGKNSDDQITYILNDLPNYFRILFATIKRYAGYYFYTMLGQQLSWYNVYVPKAYIIVWAILLIAATFGEEKAPENFGVVRVVFAIIIVAISLLIMTSLYVQWTDQNAELIAGVQGRYFIPLILPLLLIFVFGIPHELRDIFSLRNFILPLMTINFIIVLLLLVKFTRIGEYEKWIEYDAGWRYCNLYKETYVSDTWRQISGIWYYFDEEGYALSEEWLDIDGEKYYFAENCSLVVGWQFIDDEWYYFNSDGTALSGWLEDNDEWYYCEDGKMWYDCMTPDGYLLDEDGKRIQE